MPPSAASAASRTFSCTVSSGNTLETWNVRPSPSRVRRNGGWLRDVPAARWIEPAVGRYSPDSRLNSEVLPAPFGPMIPSSSPSATSSADIGDDVGAADVEPEVARGEDRRVTQAAWLT